MKDSKIKLISASAGSGKTWSLTRELSNTLGVGLRPEAIIATTFTNKAAGELVQSARERLLKSGDWEKAQRILDGYMGTVNSVCGRILKHYAFDAGLSPALDVLPDGEDKAVFAVATSSVIRRYAAEIAPIARRLEIDDWRELVKRITDLARSNDLKPSDLHRCAESSWDSLKRLLPKPVSDETEKNMLSNLLSAVEEAIIALQESGDSTKKTADAISKLREFSRKYSNPSDVTWADWQKLNRNEPAKRCLPLIEKLFKIVLLQPALPVFQKDLRQFITKVFLCAAEAMEAFAEHKRNHGLIDFVDQESLLLRLLSKVEVRDKLSERLDLLLVDEFQDTSPIQLALFLKLGEICGSSIWVGDQKQAIYGFRNTDPALMDSVIERLMGSGDLEVLEHSYRSRPPLVEFTSALFAEAFATHGIESERVRLTAKREEPPGMPDPLMVWRIDAKNMGQESAAIAGGIRDLLGHPKDFPVLDKEKNIWRPVRGGDVAVLCRTNDKCEQIAAALESFGIRAAIPNEGLLSQPECILAFAALRYLVDENDTLALAEIMHYSEGERKGGAWFAGWLDLPEKGPPRDHPLVQRLDEKRKSSIHLTPAESLDVGISAVELERQLAGWGNLRKRLANLDRLRGLAFKYQDHCLANRFAATAAGLVTWLSNLDEDLNKQAEGKDENSVDILTYHRAKGLEWPVVVLSDLQSAEKSELFGVHVNPPGEDFDAAKPLAGRKVRFWPWPYGGLKKMDWLDTVAAASPEQAQTALKERRELIRLLYVGMTRARDYLILAARLEGKSCTAWLDRFEDINGKRIFKLPSESGASIIEIAGKVFPAQTRVLCPDEPETAPAVPKVFAASPPPGPQPEFPPATFAPSHSGALLSWKFSVRNRYSLGERLELGSGVNMNEVGEVFHAFFAADRPFFSQHARKVIAERILRNWKTLALAPESLLLAGDRLREFVGKIAAEEPRWLREWPVCLKVGDQKARGWIDLLVESPAGFYIVDHKSFPGRTSDLEKKALDYAPQLAIYREAVEKATGRAVLGLFIHMPVAGEVIELEAINA